MSAAEAEKPGLDNLADTLAKEARAAAPAEAAVAAVKTDGLAQRIIKAAANVAGMSKDSFVRSHSREMSLVRSRAACACLLRDMLAMSLPEIGRLLHYSDHTTVLYHLKNTCHKPETQKRIAEIRTELGHLEQVRIAATSDLSASEPEPKAPETAKPTAHVRPKSKKRRRGDQAA